MDVLGELRKLGHSLNPGNPTIPVALSDVGTIGHVEPGRRGLYINSMLESHVDALIRDNDRAEAVAREVSGGRYTAAQLLEVARLGTDSRDAIRAIKSMRGAITSWDAVTSARSNGQSWDYMGTKASQTTVANQWSSFLRTAGSPAAMTYTGIPGPPARSSTDTGAWPLPISLGVSDDLYLTNFGTNHATGTNIVLLVDVLQAAGNISATIVTSQNVTTTALPRWTGGAGLQMTLEVTTAFGTATGIPNVTINYVDQSGNAAESTSAISIGATSLIAGRLLPLQDGPMIRLNSGDFGVRSINQVTFSASSAGAGAACAAIIYKPLLLVPTLAVTSFVERSTPAQLGGIRRLTSVTQGSMPCLGFFVLPSTTSTGVQTYMIETVWG
jgi:hypothetical protein